MEIILSVWKYLTQTAPYLLLGLCGAGVIHSFIRIEFIRRHLGGNGLLSILKASFVGIPLPLCSCSVVPAAVELRKSGAGNAPVSSFLISTPESGVDSMAMTYGMMDLPMTLIRPVAAFLTSTLAGIFQAFLNPFECKTNPAKPSCCSKTSKSSKWKRALEYGLGDLVDDLAPWLAVGLLLGGVLEFIVPDNFLENINGLTGRLLVLGVGIPFYVCASASTPIAGALILKGMDPGTALIFLLTGPATNLSNMVVLQQYIGKRGVLINIIIIALVSLILSYLVDFLYGYYHWSLDFRIGQHHNKTGGILQHLMAAFLLILLAKGIYRSKIAPAFRRKANT